MTLKSYYALPEECFSLKEISAEEMIFLITLFTQAFGNPKIDKRFKGKETLLAFYWENSAEDQVVWTYSEPSGKQHYYFERAVK